MRYLSVCSGIEAATVAWHPLGWTPVGFAEIESFPSAVLAHHYPTVPNLGDLTRYREWPDVRPDLIVGGTPCQSFSVAGLRAGLADPRGNLALTFLGLVDRYRPRWVVWGNVPGVLSSGRGRDFGAFLGGLGQLGYGWAYRVLDAQYVRVDGLERAVPQRRRRVFVVGCVGGEWQRAAAVLFEPACLSGHPAPRRAAGQGSAPTLSRRPTGGGGLGTDFDCDGGLIPEVANPLTARMHKGVNTTMDEGQTMVAHALCAEGFNASEDGTGRGTPLVAIDLQQVTSRANRTRPSPESPPLTTNGQVVAFAIQERAVSTGTSGPDGKGVREELAYTLEARNKVQSVAHHAAVRRLTPRECERLQGFQWRCGPDLPGAWRDEAGRWWSPDYTAVPYRGKLAADGPRYKALGNSMAVPVMRWIGRRVEAVESASVRAVA